MERHWAVDERTPSQTGVTSEAVGPGDDSSQQAQNKPGASF